MLCQFGKVLYVMVRRLPNCLIGKCLGHFRYLSVVYWFVNAFVHQWGKDFIHKNFEICIYRLFMPSFKHHKQLWQVGTCHLEKLD